MNAKMIDQGTKQVSYDMDMKSKGEGKSRIDYPNLSLKNLSGTYKNEIGDEVTIIIKAKLIAEERGETYGREAGKSKESKCTFHVLSAGVDSPKDHIKESFAKAKEKAKSY